MIKLEDYKLSDGSYDYNQFDLDSIIEKIEEGLNVYDNREIEITDDHEDGVDTSISNNPTKRRFKVSDDLTIDLYSIVTRNDKLEQDENLLLYALKNENGYKFKSIKALEFFWKRFDDILTKFVNQYGYNKSAVIYCQEPIYDGGILLPSNHYINKEIARRIKSKFNNKLLVIDDILMKLDPDQVYEECIAPDSYFKKYWKSKGELQYKEKLDLLKRSIHKMNNSPEQCFSMHYLHKSIRPYILKTMTLNGKYIYAYNQYINDKNILFIDDSITFGQSLKEAINVILDTYQPKSVTALTMLSQKQY